MNSKWTDGINDRDWAGGEIYESPELCPHGKPALCDACVEAFQDWARQQAPKKPATATAPTRDKETA